jgi:hypothetical protein
MHRRALVVCLLLLVPVVSVAQTRPPRKQPDATTAPVEKRIPATGDEPHITNFGVVRGNQYAGKCGATIAFEGRELVPGKFEAHLGSTSLTLTKESTNRMEAKLPEQDTGPAKLTVRHVRGKSLTLRDDFVVYCKPKITDVSPPTLRTGDVLTIRGVGLNDVIQAGGWYDDNDGRPLPDEKQYQNRVLLGATSLAINPTGMPSGVRSLPQVNRNGTELKVTVGFPLDFNGRSYPDECLTEKRTNTGENCPSLPQTVSGPLKLASRDQRRTDTSKFDVVGPSVSYTRTEKDPGQLAIADVSAAETWGGAKARFIILVPASKQYTVKIAPRALQNLVYVEGSGFKRVEFRVGDTPVRHTETSDTRSVLELPDNAVTGKVCATAGGKTVCSASDLVVIGPPTVRTLADTPWDVGTRIVMDGYDLKSTAASGLVYEFRLVQDSNDVRTCKIDARVLSHTARQIAFQFGEAGIAMPAACARAHAFQPPARNGGIDRQTAGSWQLVATYNGQTKILLGEMFYLKGPAGTTR